MTNVALETPESGVRTPALDLRALREKEPVAVMAPKKLPITLVIPMAIISWLG